jgi:hypothetical protein
MVGHNYIASTKPGAFYMAIMNAGPGCGWTGKQLAQQLQVKPRSMLTQLAEWTRLGFLTRTGAGTYASAIPS